MTADEPETQIVTNPSLEQLTGPLVAVAVETTVLQPICVLMMAPSSHVQVFPQASHVQPYPLGYVTLPYKHPRGGGLTVPTELAVAAHPPR